MKNAPLLNLFLAVALVILIGWLLVAGRTVLLPIVTALISVYVLAAATEALGRLPVTRVLPVFLLRVVVLVGFAGIVLVFAGVISATFREISVLAPTYQQNLETLLDRVAGILNLDTSELWDQIEAVTIDRIDLRAIVLSMLGGFTSLGAGVFLTVIYAGFLLAERETFALKIAAAFPDKQRAQQLLEVIARINTQIRDYISVKTLINVILGAISYGILLMMGVDFALFWALTIALLNYIPYVGSYIAVTFPVLLSLAQFGDLGKTILLTVLLTAVQMLIGNVVEPRMIGRQLNLSPFMVLVSLSVWASLWGIPGAILAVPMTSILAIVLASFDATRPVSVLISDRVDSQTNDT